MALFGMRLPRLEGKFLPFLSLSPGVAFPGASGNKSSNHRVTNGLNGLKRDLRVHSSSLMLDYIPLNRCESDHTSRACL